MEAVSISETSFNLYEIARRNIPEARIRFYILTAIKLLMLVFGFVTPLDL
jgi:hypothetical protein